ncbi:MAG: hypothetical protein ABSA76_07120 [Bacteroidales bacterium]
MFSNILNKKAFAAFLFFAISLIFTIAIGKYFFFWDTISQVSIPANWYYDNNFRYFFVPDEFATGHPTFVGMYIAILWKFLGKTLLVSHLALFPFIFGILYQVFRYIERSQERHLIIWLIFIFVFLDPTLVSQLSLITFDIIQIFLFLWCINSIIDKKGFQLSIAFIAICMTSLRGMICGGGILIFNILYGYFNNKRISVRTLLNYLPGIVISLLFFGFFYLNKHWIIHNTVSNKWAKFSELASPGEIIRNIGIFGWRLVDYGRIGLWSVFAFILIKLLKLKTIENTFLKNTMIIALTQVLVFFPVCIIYRNPFGHRYFLPIIIMVAIFTVFWIIKYTKRRWLLYSLISAVLFSGWFWVYPDKISQGWDATPAHWPYYRIRKEMLNYIESEKIPVSNVGSFFPNTKSFRLTDLSNCDLTFYDDENLISEYVLFSNVYNQKDEVINELFKSGNWIQIKTISRRNVYMILFKRK